MFIKDGETPVTPKVWWEDLWADLQDLQPRDKDGPLKVLVMCQGGHGRTGTVLLALALVAGAVPEGTDPVTWLRGVYCEEALETTRQITYLEEVFSFKTKEKALPLVAWGGTTVGTAGSGKGGGTGVKATPVGICGSCGAQVYDWDAHRSWCRFYGADNQVSNEEDEEGFGMGVCPHCGGPYYDWDSHVANVCPGVELLTDDDDPLTWDEDDPRWEQYLKGL